jgi:hypothetical protein
MSCARCKSEIVSKDGRSENSWHAVSRVIDDSTSSRRSVSLAFYRPGSVSTIWPPDDCIPLYPYKAADLT